MMAIIGYVRPEFEQSSFTCPHCNCFSQHHWRAIQVSQGSVVNIHQWTTSWCLHCKQYCFWGDESLVWPLKSGLPDPIDGCPKQIQAVYDEARQVFAHSPRASAALLRLAIQLICKQKGLPGVKLNDEIGDLVKNHGLSPQIQQSLDLVRVVGNNAVHPGQIEIEDNVENIRQFFGLVNMAVDSLIVQPARVQAMYDAMVPQTAKEGIQRRDNGGKAPVKTAPTTTSEPSAHGSR